MINGATFGRYAHIEGRVFVAGAAEDCARCGKPGAEMHAYMGPGQIEEILKGDSEPWCDRCMKRDELERLRDKVALLEDELDK